MHSVIIKRIIEDRECPVGHSAVCPYVILCVLSVKLLNDLMTFGIEVCSGSCQTNLTFVPIGFVWYMFCRKLKPEIKFLPKYLTLTTAVTFLCIYALLNGAVSSSACIM
jgi:hypothetical protein